MAQDPNEVFNEQRRQQFEQSQNARGTMETVNLEQRQAQSTNAKIQGWVINALAVFGALSAIYFILDAIF